MFWNNSIWFRAACKNQLCTLKNKSNLIAKTEFLLESKISAQSVSLSTQPFVYTMSPQETWTPYIIVSVYALDRTVFDDFTDRRSIIRLCHYVLQYQFSVISGCKDSWQSKTGQSAEEIIWREGKFGACGSFWNANLVRDWCELIAVFWLLTWVSRGLWTTLFNLKYASMMFPESTICCDDR